MTPQEKQDASSPGGLVVENVGGAAAVAGIQPGDVVVGVNGRRVDSVEQLRQAAGKAKGTVALLVQRGDAQIFVPVPVG
jgi:serine protease Do